MTIKKVLLIVLVVVILIGGIAGALYKQAMTKAALTQAVLIERAQTLSRNYETDRVKFAQRDENATIVILALQKKSAEKDRMSQLILTKNANEIRALRFTVGTWEEKYNRLEPECLQLSAKIAAQDETIGLLKLTISEMNERDNVKLEYINKLNAQLKECQTLLDKSIANTKSILKKSFILKIFDRLSIVAGAGVGSDGVVRPVIAAGIRIL